MLSLKDWIIQTISLKKKTWIILLLVYCFLICTVIFLKSVDLYILLFSISGSILITILNGFMINLLILTFPFVKVYYRIIVFVPVLLTSWVLIMGQLIMNDTIYYYFPSSQKTIIAKVDSQYPQLGLTQYSFYKRETFFLVKDLHKSFNREDGTLLSNHKYRLDWSNNGKNVTFTFRDGTSLSLKD